MTTPKAYEKAKREPAGPRLAASSSALWVVGTAFLEAARAAGVGSRGFAWPAVQYQTCPEVFAAEVLGQALWGKQLEILRALIPATARVAVRSGHKIGKSNLAAVAALWHYASFDEARTVMTATTARQVDQILWRELRRLYGRAGRCLDCRRKEPRAIAPCEHSHELDGKLAETARSGLKAPDFREVVGFTAKEAEAVAGVSGANLLYIVDESSGVPDVIFEAIEGNRAGGARILMLGNPTKTEGEHYEAFSSKKHLYSTFTVSSEETPNVVAGRIVIPGLATRQWVDEKREEWGEDSALYQIRVRGLHVLKEDGKILPVAVIVEAEERWLDVPTPTEGRLVIGLDVAGERGIGDETVYAPRRGTKILALHPFQGLTDEQHVAHARMIIRANRLDGSRPDPELPLVVIDKLGPVGEKVWRAFVAAAEKDGDFVVVGIRASDRAQRDPTNYATIRDELWANVRRWIREDEGCFPPDVKLAAELHAPEWKPTLDGKKLKATPTEEIRKKLKRSPDRASAVALAVWTSDGEPPAVQAMRHEAPTVDAPGGGAIDPYAGLDVWRR